MSKNLKLVKRIASIATAICVVAGMMVSASAYGITAPTGGFVFDGAQTSVTVPVTGTSSSGQVTIVVRTEGDAWLTDPNNNVIFIDQVTGAEGSTSITFGIDNKWLSKPGVYKVYVGGSSQAVTSANLIIGDDIEIPVELESIEIAAGAKTEYTEGDAFVAPTVTGKYSDGSSKTVAATFSGYDMNKAGKQTVTATFEGKTATYTINVAAAVVTPPTGDIEIDTLYDDTFEEGKAVIDVTLGADNGAKTITVGGAELFYSVQRKIYVGLVDEANISGNKLLNVVVTDTEPTPVIYGNIDGDYDIEDIDEAVDSSDLQALKQFLKTKKIFGILK
jgi:hypothetical protein